MNASDMNYLAKRIAEEIKRPKIKVSHKAKNYESSFDETFNWSICSDSKN